LLPAAVHDGKGWRNILGPFVFIGVHSWFTPFSSMNMKTIQVYDPPMCCSTGLCGTEIDPVLVSFAALLTQLSQKGVKVERFNLGQQPMAFVQNTAVKALLDKEGVGVLPLIFVDGEVRVKGRYLTDAERETLSRTALGESAGVSL
jgi:hypothetical protein